MPSTTTSSPVLSLRSVSVEYAGTPALRGIDFEARAGALTAVAGPNGAGKSTLLEVLAGTIAPSVGTVSVRAGSRAFVPQRADIPSTVPLTVRDVVTVGAWRHLGLWRRMSPTARRAVDDALDHVGLAALERVPFGALSGGQQQRALLAQGLASRADILLLDEPTTALDKDSSTRIMSAVRAEADRGVCVVCVSHDQALIDASDAVVRLAAGRVVA